MVVYKHSYVKEHPPTARLNLAVSKDQLRLGRGSAGYDWYVVGQKKLLMCGDGSWDRTSHGMILQKRSIRFTYPYSKQMMAARPKRSTPCRQGGDVWWNHHIHSLCVAVRPCPRSFGGVFSLKSIWIGTIDHWIYRPKEYLLVTITVSSLLAKILLPQSNVFFGPNTSCNLLKSFNILNFLRSRSLVCLVYKNHPDPLFVCWVSLKNQNPNLQ